MSVRPPRAGRGHQQNNKPDQVADEAFNRTSNRTILLFQENFSLTNLRQLLCND